MENIWDFVFSAILLLAMVSIYEFVTSAVNFPNKKVEIMVSGVGVGLLAIILLNNPVTVIEGIFVDARWVWLSCCAIFLNWRIVIIGGVMAASYRYLQGGDGAFPGVITVICAIVTGFVWRQILVRNKWEFKWYLHYIFAVILELSILLVIYIFMPNDKGPMVVNVVAQPLLILFPVLSTVLSLLLQHHYKKGIAAFY